MFYHVVMSNLIKIDKKLDIDPYVHNTTWAQRN